VPKLSRLYVVEHLVLLPFLCRACAMPDSHVGSGIGW
jgi:hypothetical protein